ncbi:hypothetical protein K501DRAFT_267077 [Backusella circina FSU 941]|nr:hypothetical protein K501DRAFT_267077 [Backusella circina FSU 941]
MSQSLSILLLVLNSYLKRKPNRHLDRLIYILVNDAMLELIRNVNRVLLGIVKALCYSSDNIYRITVIDKEMINCEYYYFKSLQNMQDTTPNTSETYQPDSDYLQKHQNSTILKDIKDLLNHFSSVESQESFDEEDLESLYTPKRQLIMRKSKNDEVSLPNNINLNTQRR